MLPSTGDGQFVLFANLEILPISSSHGYLDYWGTRVNSFEILTPHGSCPSPRRAWSRCSAPSIRPTSPAWDELAARMHVASTRSSSSGRRRSPRRPTRWWRSRRTSRQPTSTRRGRGRDLPETIGGRLEYMAGRHRGAVRRRRTRGGTARASARTSPTSRSAHCARSASPRATSPATCTPMPTFPIGETIDGRVARVGRVVLRRRVARMRPDEPERHRRAARPGRPRSRLLRRRPAARHLRRADRQRVVRERRHHPRGVGAHCERAAAAQ